MCYHAGPVEVSGLLGEFVKRQKGVGVSCCAMTQSVTFLQESPVPDDLTALHGVMQVSLLTKHLSVTRRKQKHSVNNQMLMFQALQCCLV